MSHSTPLVRTTKFCHACGDVLDSRAVVCPHCGVAQAALTLPDQSEKRILPALLLWFFLGVFGAHRFYAGKIGTGVLQLLTLGGLGIWWLVDLVYLVSGTFTDDEGEKIRTWI